MVKKYLIIDKPLFIFLIYKHFRYLCENSSRDKNDKENFIKSCERLIDERIIDDKKNIIDSEEFKFELSSLQICDLISLIICREKVMGGIVIPTYQLCE